MTNETEDRGGWAKTSAEREELERLRAEQQEALDLNNEMKRLCDDACDQRDAAKQREEALRKELENKQFVIDGYDRTHERLDRKITALEAELSVRAEVVRGGEGVAIPVDGSWWIFARNQDEDNEFQPLVRGCFEAPVFPGNIAIRLPATPPSFAASDIAKSALETSYKAVAELQEKRRVVLENGMALPAAPSEQEQGERGKRLEDARIVFAHDQALSVGTRDALIDLCDILIDRRGSSRE